MLPRLIFVAPTVLSALAFFAIASGTLPAAGADGTGGRATFMAPSPTATYVSELGPASVRPPRVAEVLPAAGSVGGVAGLPWPRVAGLGLASTGILLVHAALRLRPRTAG